MKNETSITRQATIPVAGMSCGSCVRHIGEALGEIEGVISVEVSLPERSVTVGYEPGSVRLEAIVNAIRQRGYRAEMPEEKQ